MITVGHVRDPKFTHKHYPDMGVVIIKVDGSNITVNEELTIPEAIAFRDELTDMIDWISGTTIKSETAEILKKAYNRATVAGSERVTWCDEGKDAYQDGMVMALDLLGINVDGINS
ncbi:hypothetical protein D3C73_470770 [compost metagenome]